MKSPCPACLRGEKRSVEFLLRNGYCRRHANNNSFHSLCAGSQPCCANDGERGTLEGRPGLSRHNSDRAHLACRLCCPDAPVGRGGASHLRQGAGARGFPQKQAGDRHQRPARVYARPVRADCPQARAALQAAPRSGSVHFISHAYRACGARIHGLRLWADTRTGGRSRALQPHARRQSRRSRPRGAERHGAGATFVRARRGRFRRQPPRGGFQRICH